jgi:hypothetical protein
MEDGRVLLSILNAFDVFSLERSAAYSHELVLDVELVDS